MLGTRRREELRRLAAAALGVCLLAIPGAAQAKNFCTNSSTGSDATSYASLTTAATDGTGTCTATIRRAADVALAGDTVYVSPGTYNAAGTNNRFVSSLNPTNAGTSGSPITFIGVGTVNLGLSSSTGPMLGCSGRSYITWNNFSINEANGTSNADTGPVALHDAVGCIVEYLTVNGNGVGHGAVDNHNGIRMESCDDCIIRHSTITNVTTNSGNHHNGAGIMVYESNGGIIEHNAISDSGSGIFLKGGPNVGTRPGFLVRFNRLTNIAESALVSYAGAPSTTANPTIFSQNIVDGALTAFRFWHFDSGFDDPTYNFFLNNTAYNVTNCLEVVGNMTGTPNNGLWNNICSTATFGVYSNAPASYFQDTSRIDFEHNVYHSVATQHARLNVDGSTVNVTLANWKLTPYFQDADSPAGSTSDPLFTNAAGGDFHLGGSSPALTQGSAVRGIGGADGTTIPAGAYITGSETIGVGNAGGSSTVRRRRVRGAE